MSSLHPDIVGGLSGGQFSGSTGAGISNPFTMDYFICGKEKGLSNYQNYHFMEPETTAYARSLLSHLDIKGGESVHDIGCARGYLVKVLNDIGYPSTGYDISDWAISNCHPDVRDRVSNTCLYEPESVDWIHSKDCLEHWDQPSLESTLPAMMGMARKGCLFIVPMCAYWGGKYVYPADNEDRTHRIRMPLEAWMKMLMDCATKAKGDFTVHGSFHMHGLKRASVDYPYSTGFFTVRRFL